MPLEETSLAQRNESVLDNLAIDLNGVITVPSFCPKADVSSMRHFNMDCNNLDRRWWPSFPIM